MKYIAFLGFFLYIDQSIGYSKLKAVMLVTLVIT